MKNVLVICLMICLLHGCLTNTQDGAKRLDHLKQEALLSYEMDDYKATIEILDRLTILDTIPKGEYFFMRGYSKAQLFDFEGSTEDYLKSIELGYRLKDTYHNLSLNSRSQFNDTLALQYINNALSIDSLDTELLKLKKEILTGDSLTRMLNELL